MRIAKPIEIANAVSLLISEKASYINAHTLVVGGHLLKSSVYNSNSNIKGYISPMLVLQIRRYICATIPQHSAQRPTE
jgi:hypothetical protein